MKWQECVSARISLEKLLISQRLKGESYFRPWGIKVFSFAKLLSCENS